MSRLTEANLGETQHMLIRQGSAHSLQSLPPGGWRRQSGEDPFASLRFPLRRLVPPPDNGLNPRPNPKHWDRVQGFGTSANTMQLTPKYAMPFWRYGRPPPQWWHRYVAEKNRVRTPREPSPAAAAVAGQVKAALAKNLNRVIDTFREFDTDKSFAISKREFYMACREGLRVDGPRAAFNELFDIIDTDMSGEIDYRELNKVLRRRVWDPSHKQLLPDLEREQLGMMSASRSTGYLVQQG